MRKDKEPINRYRGSMVSSGRFLAIGAIFAITLGSSCRKSSGPAASEQKRLRAPLSVDVVKVVSKKLSTTVRLPAELLPYEVVSIYPKVTAFVKWIGVDRGSRVKQGEVIARLEAPELMAQKAEAESRFESAVAQLASARAKLASDEGTYLRLKAAAATPGVVAGNDLLVAEKLAEADRAQVKTQQDNAVAAEQALHAIAEIAAYLEIKAPFDGIVTERNLHPGALVGPAEAASATLPLVRIETLSRLRLVVPVPENYAAGVAPGATVQFTVPAFPDKMFSGKIARISHSIDQSTRTMPVEVDVLNPSGQLDPGSFSEVLWPVGRSYPTLFVPASAVTSTLQRTFVIRVQDGKADWVDVKTGVTTGGLTEVFGNLHENDLIILRGTDEILPGELTLARPASSG
ncbi:MAG TPA: efflux RND transporter periplasmic adaptor subunit [Terriglobia bacterium]|nr:efflux RND transporter periplasmic adaptor subunit [Terriglobia bacterium]